MKGAFGRTVKVQEARIVGWLPADESDYINDKGEAAPLWHILWNDGQEEDLEEWEVLEVCVLYCNGKSDMYLLHCSGKCLRCV